MIRTPREALRNKVGMALRAGPILSGWTLPKRETSSRKQTVRDRLGEPSLPCITKALRAVAILLSLTLPAVVPAQTPSPKPAPTLAHAAPPGLSFENYRMVRTRNVFDPDRRAMNPTQSTAPPVPIKESDYIALTGTMINAGKALAFFSGSRSDFNKVLSVRDKIADATITNITATGVEVNRAGRKLTVTVGQTVPLDNSLPADASALRATTATATSNHNGTRYHFHFARRRCYLCRRRQRPQLQTAGNHEAHDGKAQTGRTLMNTHPLVQIPPPAGGLSTYRQALVLSLVGAGVLLLPARGQSAGAQEPARPASSRQLDLALLVADAPISRPFLPPSPRSTTATAATTTPATATAASAALFAAAPIPTPADLPSVPASATPIPLPQSTASPAPVASPSTTSSTTGNGGILLNFQNASLGDVLNYLSSAAGFVIIQEQPVTGTVNLVSRQPINADEAVDLLNAVLIEKGYIAIRSGRILKIVSRENAEKRDLPVITGSDPVQIPRRDNMVTQILPVRYAEVAKLVDSMRPLLSERATITSNDSSNAILLTDTQTNIHRIAEIVRALDTSISGISTLRIFPLRYADSKGLADIITQLFSPTGTSTANGQQRGNNQQGGFPGAPNFNFGGRGGGGGGGGNRTPAQPESEARQAASRVVAVPDEQSNSVVVSAPDEYMTGIADIVARLDTNVSDVTETRIFRLIYADATELANVLSSLYTDPTSSTVGAGGNNRGGRGGGGGGFQQQFAQFLQRQGDSRSDRALLQSRVVAVPDPRTNSVLVNTSHVTMEQIALTIGRLDATDARKQHVYVHTLAHADPDNVAAILRGMYSQSTGSSSQDAQQPSTSRLSQRTTTGASSEVTGALNTNSTNGR